VEQNKELEVNVFLDLEETVINNWHDATLVNTTKVRDLLGTLGVSSVRLFSFALYHDKDRDRFNTVLKPFLERALDVKFLDSPTVEDFLLADKQITGLHWDGITDFIQVRGKIDAFRSWCKAKFDKQHNILIDDTVPNATWHNTDTGLILQYIDVKRLK
jgi:hypothetical protein